MNTWTGDACSLVDAFRAGERSPVEELEATLAAIEASDLNAFSFIDPDRATAAAETADVSLPFGGVPTGIKELEAVEGWPDTEASLVFRDRIADHTTVVTDRLLRTGGATPVGLTTASEFGGLNVSVTRLNGVTHNPWQHGRTCGGSSGGSGSAVAGGLVSLATGGDGGGSIRIPAGYTGLLGMKGTFGRTPRSPGAYMRPHTVVLGNLARSVRDAARYYDVVTGHHPADPTSLPRHPSFEAGLGRHDLAGKRVALVPDLGGVTLEPGVEELVRAEAEKLVADTGMVLVDRRVEPPNLAAQWAMGNLATLLADLGRRWPGCAEDMTGEVALGLRLATGVYNLHTAAAAEKMRVETNELMAETFADVDFIIASTNPGPAFPAEWTTSSPTDSFIEWAQTSDVATWLYRGLLGTVRTAAGFAPSVPNRLLDAATRFFPDLVGMGALTIVSNIYGNPAVSIPAGTIDGLPVGLQVLGRHHEDALLFDVALAVERERPWPQVAPTGRAATT
ncbi:MAG: amidase [Acidimicrobiales bacterium]|nr:amidase [Acidimicrobiales bacterium]